VSAEPDLVTGEAVVVDLRVARLASRGVAAALDVLLQFAVLLSMLMAILVAGISDPAQTAAILLGVFVLVRVGYSVLFETLSRGRTLGKMTLGLRVVRDDGGPVRFRHALTSGRCRCGASSRWSCRCARRGRSGSGTTSPGPW
jgi:uncharacterized RDD family membrane protein YckC